ncbi:MarR family transcriptional regulator [Planomonospora algeriensis]
MAERQADQTNGEDLFAVTSAVLTGSRLLVAIAARSLAAVEDKVTLPQFRMLVVLATHGQTKLVTLAERLSVNPSTAMRMADRLAGTQRCIWEITRSKRFMTCEEHAPGPECRAFLVSAPPVPLRK